MDPVLTESMPITNKGPTFYDQNTISVDPSIAWPTYKLNPHNELSVFENFLSLGNILVDKSLKTKSIWLMTSAFLFNGVLQLGPTVTLHEIAHQNRTYALGYVYPMNQQLVLAGDDVYRVILSHGASGFKTGRFTWENGSPDQVLFTTPFRSNVNKGILYNAGSFLNYSAGLNLQSLIAEDIGNRAAISGKNSIASLPSHLYDRLGFNLYPTGIGWGDRDLVNGMYKAREFHADDSSIARMEIAALVLSATTWSYLGAFQNGGQVLPIFFNGWRIPDYTLYYNYDGPSIKLNSGYRWSRRIYLPFSVEQTFQSLDRREFAIGIDWQAGKLGVLGQTLIGERIDGDPANPDRSQFTEFKELQYNLEMRYFLSHSLSLFSGLRSYNGNTLDGQRSIPSFKDGPAPLYTDAYIGLKWRDQGFVTQ